jgi:hypothetical protein
MFYVADVVGRQQGIALTIFPWVNCEDFIAG